MNMCPPPQLSFWLRHCLWPLKDKRNCIVHKSLKIIKLIKNAIHLTLITFVLLVFSFSAVYHWIYFVSSLSPKYYILKVLMCSFYKRNCIVDKSLKIIKLIKNAIHLTLITFVLLVFSFSAVYHWIYFVSSLSQKYYILKVLICSFVSLFSSF